MSNNNSKALKSGLWYTISNFVTKSVGIITTPIFTRLLTKEDFGSFNNYLSWVAVFSIIITLNLESTFISARFDFPKKFDEYVFSVLMLSSVSSLIWLLIFNIFAGFAQQRLGMSQIYINCMNIYLLFLPAVNMFQARERYFFEYKKSVLIGALITLGTALVSVLLVVFMHNKLKARILGSLLPTVVIGLVLYIVIAIHGKKICLEYWKYAIPICLPFVPHLLSMTVLNAVDKIMITNMCGAAENATYSVAYTCSSVITILITSLNSAFSPWLGEKLNANLIEEINAVSKKYILLFIGLAVCCMLVSPELIIILGGKNYTEALYVMPPVMLGCVYQFLYTLFVNIEQFKKKTIGMAFASASAAILNYVLNYVLIPKYGYIAAAYTTLVSYLWLLLIHMLLVRLLHYHQVYNYTFIFIIVGVMIAITIGINFLYSHTIVRLIIISACIVTMIYVLWRHKNVVSQFLHENKKT
jgi:O-antigen/teichoic acid export membrane protein